jgi:H+/gluconate symporter-like permease
VVFSLIWCRRSIVGARGMFIVTSSNARAAKKMSIPMGIALALAGFGGFLTMHVYVKPSPSAPNGFRIFGLPRFHRPS